VNWWAPVFATKENRLPKWLTWFDTFDADLDRGVTDGFFTGPPSYWNRVKWLYRNPAYGFSFFVLGVPYKKTEWILKYYVPATPSAPESFFAYTPQGYFNAVFVKFGLKFKIGWKAWNHFNVKDGKFYDSMWAATGHDMLPFVFSVSFHKSK
jgi:hypothetical protein